MLLTVKALMWNLSRLKPDFDVDDLEVAQKFAATSNDGTRFLIS